MGIRSYLIFILFFIHGITGKQNNQRLDSNTAQERLGEFPPRSGIGIFGLGSTASKILNFFGGGLMYLNLVLGNQNGFRNLTTQIQNLTSDVGLYRDEIISKIEDTEHLINHSLIFSTNPFLNNSDIFNEVLQTNTNAEDGSEGNSETLFDFLDTAAIPDQDRNDNDDDFNDTENQIDIILDTVLERMRRLEENNEMVHNSVDEVVKSVLNERKKSRVKRQTDPDREPKQSKENVREKLETVVETALRQRTHNDAQTVGSMLAQIPGILEDHGLSFDSIVSGFRSFESSIEKIANQMHEDNTQMHEDNTQMHADNTQMVNQMVAALDGMHDDSLKIQNKLTSGLDRMSSGLDKMTSGLDGIKEEMHDQLEPIALKIGDESKLDEVIHEGFHQIAEKLGDESNLDDIVHDGLHQIAEKLGDENKLEDTIHHGFETIAENLGGKSNLEDAVHDGLHGIADKLDQITTYGLDGIMDSLDKSRNPILNLPSTFGSTLGQAVGQSVGKNMFEELNDHLSSIKDSIGDHGDLLAGTITNQNIIDENEEANVLQTYDQIVTALQGMSSAIRTGHSDITNAVSLGLDNTKNAIETSGENSKVSLDVLNAAMVSTLNGGYQQLSDTLGNGHSKLADSIHDSNDALETIATNIAKAGTENKEALSSVGSKIESSNTKISTSIDTAADFIDHVKDEIKTSGEMMEVGLGNIEDKLALLETLGVNVKNLDTHLMDSLKTIASSLQAQGENLINGLSDMKDELQTVGGNIQNGKESLDKIGETLKNLEAISTFIELNVENLKSLDANTALGLQTISDTLVDASMKNKEGFEAVAALLLGTTDEGPVNIVDSLLTLASNVKESGMENKDELAKIVENIATVGTGIENVAMKTEESGDKNMNSLDSLVAGLGSLSTLVETASGYLKDNGEGSDGSMAAIKQVLEAMNDEMLASNNRLVAGLKDGHDKIADNIEDGSDNMADKISNSILTGNDQISDSIDAGNDNIADSITAGQNKVAESITAGHTKVSDSITSGQTKVSDSITAGQTKVSDSINMGNTKISDSVLAGLNNVATNVKDAGVTNKDALTDVSLKIQANADNVKQAGVDNKISLEDISSQISTAGTDNKDSLDALASAVTTGEDKVAEALNVKVNDALTSISDNVKENADNVKLAGEDNKSGLGDVAAAVTTGQDKLSLAITTGDNKIEAVLQDSKTSLDNIKGSVDVQNERILNGLNSLASNVKDAGVSNKDALADVSLKIKENADNVKQAGVDNKAGFDSLSTHTETVSNNIDKLAGNVATAGTDNKDSLDALGGKVEIAATNIQKAGDDNKMSLDAVATAMATGDDKVADALSAGDNKIEAVLQDAKTSLDTIKGAVDVQNERILNGLTSVFTNIKQAGDDNKAGLTDLGGHMETAATNLDTLATNVKDAGVSNKDALADVSLKIKENADNVKQAGVDNKEGLTSLGTHTETAATNIGTLATNVATAGNDNKESLDDISAKINTAAGHLEKSATNSDTMVATFTQFAADSKTNLEDIKVSLDTLAGNNKDGLASVEAAIKTFTTSATTDTTNIISAVAMLENSLGDSADNIETELDKIRQAIITAQGRTAQLAAIKRLADKIECTEDCFVSEVQADAILEGLNRNDDNLNSLTGDLNALAINPIVTPAPENENERNDPTILSLNRRSFASQEVDNLGFDLADLIVALQNPEFNITKEMQKKGHDFNELMKLLKNVFESDQVENEEKFIKFLKDANIKIPKTQKVTENLKRNGKALINLGESAFSIIEIEQILKKTGNSSDIKKDLLRLVENFSKLENYQKMSRENGVQRSWSKVDVAQFLANFLMNPLTAVFISRGVEQVLARVYNNKFEETWQELEPAGYLDSGYGKFPLEIPENYRKLPTGFGQKSLRTTFCDENQDCTDESFPFCDVDSTFIQDDESAVSICNSVIDCTVSSNCTKTDDGTSATCNSDGKCVKKCVKNQDCSNGAYPFCVLSSSRVFRWFRSSSGFCEKEKTCTENKDCATFDKEYICSKEGKCKEKNPITRYITKTDGAVLIDQRRNAIQENIQALKYGADSIYAFKTDQRTEWVSEKWNKHNHVQWIIDMSQEITKDTLDFLKEQFNIRTYTAINEADNAQERYRNIVKSNGVKVQKDVNELIEKMNKWLIEKNEELRKVKLRLKKGDQQKFQKEIANLRTKKKELQEKIDDIDKKLDKKLDEEVTPKCPVTNSKIDDLTSNLVSVSFSGLEAIENTNNECQAELNKYFNFMKDEYEILEFEYEIEFDTIRQTISDLVKSSSPRGVDLRSRQASTTDDRWDYTDNIFDIMIRNNEDLVTALVGKFPADDSKNILTGMEKSTEDIKTALTNIETALKGFTRKLTSKFTAIKTYADSHTHVCTPMACALTQTGLPPLVYPPSARNVLNTTQEEYNQTVAWVNQLFANETLDASETAIKDYILSHSNVLAEILQPFLDDLKKEIIAKNETQIVDAKQAKSPEVDVHVFTLHEGGDSDNRIDHTAHDKDHHHDHQHHHHGEEHNTVDNAIIQEVGEIIDEERKLSKKFSGIADILEKKLEAVEKKSRMDREEEDLSNRASWISGTEQMKKFAKKDGSKLEEKAFIFNLF